MLMLYQYSKDINEAAKTAAGILMKLKSTNNFVREQEVFLAAK